MSFATPMFQAAVFPIILLLLLYYSRRYHLPPGPPGNVAGEFKSLRMRLCPRYLKSGGEGMRGEIYSSRPRHEILSDGKRGLSARTLQHIGMNGKAALYYREQQTLEAAILLREILASANGLEQALQRFVTSIALGIAYGRRILDLKDDMVTFNRESGLAFQENTSWKPGRGFFGFLYEHLHLAHKGPFGSSGFKTGPAKSHPNLAKLAFSKLDHAILAGAGFETGATERALTYSGIAKGCMATYSLSRAGNQGMTDIEIAYALSTPFSAGVDTVRPLVLPEPVSMLTVAIAFTRWRPVVPLGVPHATTKADVYDGYDIPKGASVFSNIDSVTPDAPIHSVLVMDPNLFDDPETFNPSRFLTPHKPAGKWNGKVESDFTMPFGFGRRICPGMHVALQTTFLYMARIFWAFDVLPAVEGSSIDSTKTISRGITREPAPFQFRVRARHPDVERIIESESADADLRLKKWEY
ncbi:cytochrome P450 [Russula emetica]|nr:cytochrome P450 [Russula emetica]